MGDMVWALMNSIEFAWVLKIVLLIMVAGLVVYAFSKEGRDERGRAIIGTACIWGFVAFFVAMNVFSLFTNSIMENGPVMFTNAYCLVTLAFLVPLWILILVLRKTR